MVGAGPALTNRLVGAGGMRFPSRERASEGWYKNRNTSAKKINNDINLLILLAIYTLDIVHVSRFNPLHQPLIHFVNTNCAVCTYR